MKKILILIPTLLFLTGCGHNILTVQEGTYLNLGFNSNTNDLGIQYTDGSNITIINRENTKLEIEMTDALDGEGKAVRKVSKIVYEIKNQKNGYNK